MQQIAILRSEVVALKGSNIARGVTIASLQTEIATLKVINTQLESEVKTLKAAIPTEANLVLQGHTKRTDEEKVAITLALPLCR